MSFNAHELSNRLLNALDTNYNVVDMHTVNEIISILEKYNITKELLETTRLGKHVNELRRKTADPGLARRAKVLVKRWRDLVIPTVPSPGHTGSNRSSAERQMRMSRLGGTPLTSPALIRNVVSPAVASPRPVLRPAWGGYESDSQDVILVDDDPPAAPPLPLPVKHDKAIKPSLSPVLVIEDKKSKRDKKPKKRRGHSRAGSGSEAAIADGTWPARNGSASPVIAAAPAAAPAPAPLRRNGCRRPQVDAYAALVNRMPPAGAKKVKTTKELLEEIQSRGAKPAHLSPSRADSASPDVMLVEPDPSPPTISVASPLRNGSPLPPPASPHHHRPHLDEYASREFAECTCEEEGQSDCPAAVSLALRPVHVIALHNGRVPGVNGTGAPVHPHQFAVRKLTDPDKPGLFTSVVPLYKYSDYADDYCVKNLTRVPLCPHLPFTEFAPSPPPPPQPPSPPPIRPYPIDDTVIKSEPADPSEREDGESPAQSETEDMDTAEGVNERLKSPPVCREVTELTDVNVEFPPPSEEVAPAQFESVRSEHRTVERTKVKDDEPMDGQALWELCAKARASIAFNYAQTESAPLVSLHDDDDTLAAALATTDSARDDLGRPLPPADFAEWHECAMLGDLIALPYVVID